VTLALVRAVVTLTFRLFDRVLQSAAVAPDRPHRGQAASPVGDSLSTVLRRRSSSWAASGNDGRITTAGKDERQVDVTDLSDPNLYSDVSALLNSALPDGLLALAIAES
jgi:hypothetical protein